MEESVLYCNDGGSRAHCRALFETGLGARASRQGKGKRKESASERWQKLATGAGAVIALNSGTLSKSLNVEDLEVEKKFLVIWG